MAKINTKKPMPPMAKSDKMHTMVGKMTVAPDGKREKKVPAAKGRKC